jgi:hypothetical protein
MKCFMDGAPAVGMVPFAPPESIIKFLICNDVTGFRSVVYCAAPPRNGGRQPLKYLLRPVISSNSCLLTV